MEHFSKSVLESGLSIKDIIQVSMDGPNVNWKFLKTYKRKSPTSMVTPSSILGHVAFMWYTTALREEWRQQGGRCLPFCQVFTISSKMPQLGRKILSAQVAVLWCLLNLSTTGGWKTYHCERTLKIWDSICAYVKAAEAGKVNKPKNKSYQIIKESLSNLHSIIVLSFQSTKQIGQWYLSWVMTCARS